MKSSKKSFIKILFLFVFAFALTCNSSLFARDFYQIKVYTIKDAAQETRMDNYLKDAFIPAMHRAGVEKVGVFKPIAEDPAAGTKVFVFIPIKKLDDILKIEAKLAKDNVYQTKGSDYINAKHDDSPYVRIESILLKSFAEMPEYFAPKHKTPKTEQIYELRSYHGATEKLYQKKVEMFNVAGEVALFKKLDFNAVFYGEVISGASMPNLMYMTTFSSKESQAEHWDAFRTHPDWDKMKNMEEYKNTVSHIDKWLMHPAEYSDI